MGRMAGVKLLLRSAMIFFGTLMAAGLVALGEPAASRMEGLASHDSSTMQALNETVDLARPAAAIAPTQRGR